MFDFKNTAKYVEIEAYRSLTLRTQQGTAMLRQ